MISSAFDLVIRADLSSSRSLIGVRLPPLKLFKSSYCWLIGDFSSMTGRLAFLASRFSSLDSYCDAGSRSVIIPRLRGTLIVPIRAGLDSSDVN